MGVSAQAEVRIVLKRSLKLERLIPYRHIQADVKRWFENPETTSFPRDLKDQKGRDPPKAKLGKTLMQ